MSNTLIENHDNGDSHTFTEQVTPSVARRHMRAAHGTDIEVTIIAAPPEESYISSKGRRVPLLPENVAVKLSGPKKQYETFWRNDAQRQEKLIALQSARKQ